MNEIASSQERAHQNEYVCRVSARLVCQELNGELLKVRKLEALVWNEGRRVPHFILKSLDLTISKSFPLGFLTDQSF